MHMLRRFLPLLLLGCILALPAPSHAQVGVGISVNLAPPPLPIYAEPPLPEDGYIFTPGYWSWGPSGYYWVPGTWVLPPQEGLLWTPGYWAFVDGAYVWSAGYWGPHIGYYGGINYGFGYFGTGYEGGYWEHNHFYYNSAIHNFGSVHVTNVYRRTIPASGGGRVSFAAAPRGGAARPAADEETSAHETHAAPSAPQSRHENAAASFHPALATVNRGRPQVAATPRPATFTGRGVVSAQRAAPPAAHPAAAHAAPAARPAPPARAAPAARPAAAAKPAAPKGHEEPEHH